MDPFSSDSDQLNSENESRFPIFDYDAAYQEGETLKILAYGLGRAQVRKQLSDNKVARGFKRVERSARPQEKSQDQSGPLVEEPLLQL